MEYAARGTSKVGEANDRQKSGSPLVNPSMTFIDGHLAAEIPARTEGGGRGITADR